MHRPCGGFWGCRWRPRALLSNAARSRPSRGLGSARFGSVRLGKARSLRPRTSPPRRPLSDLSPGRCSARLPAPAPPPPPPWNAARSARGLPAACTEIAELSCRHLAPGPRGPRDPPEAPGPRSTWTRGALKPPAGARCGMRQKIYFRNFRNIFKL
ncbi:heat shock factor-binding protein 1-like protein 1 isoform X1 [Macaca thibetana thibetana]|uniref:heat shock factor-binding protein 1-like protein 1 isoform X1 n=1 Tax=Macaca thibetana thibetana TaxID=257877 RepID=UPI0021BC98C5|nr:heat shock factor-binding protein 1-like protein 1 isoform X1 [Macaca thibetana thibetana]